MKLKNILGMAALSIFLLLPMGCATTGGPSGAEKVARVALVLRTAANAAAVLAIEDNADNRRHVELAVVILDQFILAGEYKPGELVAALAPVIQELQKPIISLSVNTFLNLYEGLYADYVKGKISGNENARALLTALRDGAKAALVTGNINQRGWAPAATVAK